MTYIQYSVVHGGSGTAEPDFITPEGRERVDFGDPKQLLEGAREERLEVVDLLAAPTESLAKIRRKRQAGQMLSRAKPDGGGVLRAAGGGRLL